MTMSLMSRIFTQCPKTKERNEANNQAKGPIAVVDTRVTFMINQNGVIAQKDLWPDSAKLASAITEYNPEKTWKELDA